MDADMGMRRGNGPLSDRRNRYVCRPQGAELSALLARPRLLRARPPGGVHDVRLDHVGGRQGPARARLSRDGAGRAARPLPALRRRPRGSHQPAAAPARDADRDRADADGGLRADRPRAGPRRAPAAPGRAQQLLPGLRRAEPHGAHPPARRARAASERDRARLHPVAGRPHDRAVDHRHPHRRVRRGHRLRAWRRPRPTSRSGSTAGCTSRATPPPTTAATCCGSSRRGWASSRTTSSS